MLKICMIHCKTLQNGFLLSQKMFIIKFLNIFLKDIKIIPRQHCLNTVVINENWEYPSTEIFKDVSIYLKKNNIKSCGIATAIYPNYYFQKNEKKERYAKIIIPVELD